MMDREMAGYDAFPVEAINTLQFRNISDGGPSMYRVIVRKNHVITAQVILIVRN
jgi:hypothetical protein